MKEWKTGFIEAINLFSVIKILIGIIWTPKTQYQQLKHNICLHILKLTRIYRFWFQGYDQIISLSYREIFGSLTVFRQISKRCSDTYPMIVRSVL